MFKIVFTNKIKIKSNIPNENKLQDQENHEKGF